MNRWGMLIILLVVLLCAGCTGSVSTPDNNTGTEPGQPAVNQDQAQAPNGDPSSPPSKEPAAAANQAAAEPGADPNQPISDVDANANAGTSAEPGGGLNAPAGSGTDGLAKSPGSSATTVNLWVTRDFAQSQLHGSKAAFSPGDSVMDILKKHLDIDTEYGGGFVESINGLSSGYTGADKKTRDWFYYANGIITSVGALDYKPSPGDVIWWDYHDWGGAVFTPALIGAFPEPFVSGYRGQKPGTVVLTAPGCEQQGRQLADQLRNLGAEKVTVQPYEEKIVTGSDKITLVVGLWEQFADERFWQGMQKQRKKTGLFIELAPDYFATLDMNGDIVEKYNQQVGAITATGSGMGDPTPLWLVTGLDQAGLDEAVSVFTTKPGSFKQYFGAVITGGQVLPVPAK